MTMRKRERNAAHFILLVLFTAFVLLFANIAVYAALFAGWEEDIPFGSRTITDNLTEDHGNYIFSEDGKAALERSDLFVMIISQEGHILWSERLPEELKKDYTLQDVALFTRYYLNDYPVHTYIIPEGLLVIGSQKHTTWKYTLEFNEGMVRQFVRQMPVITLVNIVLLISVPLFIQRKWLLRREEERTEWIAGVSHDIRTPLTLILGGADHIKRSTGDPAAAEKADVIERQGLRIRALIANLNTSSKLDFGMGDYRRSSVKLCGLLRKTAADFINRCSDDKYSFSINIDDSLSDKTVKANAELFERMLENLLGNSIRHNPGGCDIRIELYPGNTRRGVCVLRISDNGIGAAEETLKRLNRRIPDKPGSLKDHGIGLRLVKQIAKYHSWKAEFSGNRPRGFVCTIVMR